MAALWGRLRRFVRNLLLLAGLVVVAANVYMLWVTAAVTYQHATDVPARPTAIVLGTNIQNGAPSQELAERLAAAADLYFAHKVTNVIVSGAVYGATSEPAVMAHWLLGRGLPASAVKQDLLGVRTRATMERAVHVFGVHAAVICTQAYHEPRALLLASKAGIDAVGLVGDPGQVMRHSLREIMARPAMLLETLIWPLH